ncbi:MAG: radical SAM protein [Polyangiaceae bacterium]|nr:radical SAM protein [Polyangiaceae bacterium]
MEPKTQVEIQLGHMCNNRCVFCVSGQETALGRARPLDREPILAEIRAAFAAGHRKITLLGGEPTLQPAFLDVVRETVALGFEEIVLFTNGVKTARASFVDEILATGGRFTFRFSLQGATEEAHERTTRKDGSFARLLQSMRHVHERGQKLTVNMCVVKSNYESVDVFPELLLPLEASQLHLDMVRPLDAGVRTEAEFADMIPRYSDMVPALERMIRGFPKGFDVNIGNLPYCIAPHLAPFIHHDGEKTMTIAVDGDKKLSKPWDKYLVKRRDKSKPEGCRTCVFESRCSGVFEKYRELYGDAEFVPVSLEKLATVDPERESFAVHARALVGQAFRDFAPPAPYSALELVELGEKAVSVRLVGSDALCIELRPRSAGQGMGAFDWFSVWLTKAPADSAVAMIGLCALRERLAAVVKVVHPIAEDAIVPTLRSVAARLLALRQKAPFGALKWTDVRVQDAGRRAELRLEGPRGEEAWVWLGERDGRPVGGYRVAEGAVTDEVKEGLRAVMAALGPR